MNKPIKTMKNVVVGQKICLRGDGWTIGYRELHRCAPIGFHPSNTQHHITCRPENVAPMLTEFEAVDVIEVEPRVSPRACQWLKVKNDRVGEMWVFITNSYDIWTPKEVERWRKQVAGE
jgi:hypothetical protein